MIVGNGAAGQCPRFHRRNEEDNAEDQSALALALNLLAFTVDDCLA